MFKHIAVVYSYLVASTDFLRLFYLSSFPIYNFSRVLHVYRFFFSSLGLVLWIIYYYHLLGQIPRRQGIQPTLSCREPPPLPLPFTSFSCRWCWLLWVCSLFDMKRIPYFMKITFDAKGLRLCLTSIPKQLFFVLESKSEVNIERI